MKCKRHTCSTNPSLGFTEILRHVFFGHILCEWNISPMWDATCKQVVKFLLLLIDEVFYFLLALCQNCTPAQFYRAYFFHKSKGMLTQVSTHPSGNTCHSTGFTHDPFQIKKISSQSSTQISVTQYHKGHRNLLEYLNYVTLIHWHPWP